MGMDARVRVVGSSAIRITQPQSELNPITTGLGAPMLGLAWVSATALHPWRNLLFINCKLAYSARAPLESQN